MQFALPDKQLTRLLTDAICTQSNLELSYADCHSVHEFEVFYELLRDTKVDIQSSKTVVMCMFVVAMVVFDGLM